ncbi:MAG: hypothetical protein GY810_25955 [Aureispira sp.]|nr:hypothetical protein [Aureispira sp.]
MFRIVLILISTFFACQTPESNPVENTTTLNTIDSNETPEILQVDLDSAEIDTNHHQLRLSPLDQSYSQVKREIAKKQAAFLTTYSKHKDSTHKDSIITQAADYLTETLVNQIIPYWYGTTWDFSGYTDKPNDGMIGCSYFVSTTLLHAGFNINRYKLAQQGPLSEAKSLQLQDTVLRLDGLDNLYNTVLDNHSDGLFFIGLDHYHVGYLLKRQGEVFFLQSSYDESMAVIIEKAMHSGILESYSTFWLVPITAQKALIEAWILKKSITVVKGKE